MIFKGMLLQMSNQPLLDAEVAEKPLQMITYVEPAIPSHTFMKFELTQQPSFGFLGWMEGRRLVARNTRTTKIKKCQEVRGKHFVDTLSGSCLCQENVTVCMPCNPFWQRMCLPSAKWACCCHVQRWSCRSFTKSLAAPKCMTHVQCEWIPQISTI